VLTYNSLLAAERDLMEAVLEEAEEAEEVVAALA
jgi:hypothetical protein